MIVLIMDIATTELVSVEKDLLELIVQLHLAQIIVSLVVLVLITPVFALQDGLTLIVLLNFVPMIVMEMESVKMVHVFVILILVLMIAQNQSASETVTQMVFV